MERGRLAEPSIAILERLKKGREDKPCGINEADYVGVEGTIHGIHDSKLSQSLHGEQQHETNNEITDNLGVKLSVTGNIEHRVRSQHTKGAGPPLWRAPPELMKRPAPIAPPIDRISQRHEQPCRRWA